MYRRCVAHQCLLCVKTEGVGGSSTGGDGACSTGGMPEEVGFRDNRFAYAAAGLVACAYSGNKLLAAFVLRFADTSAGETTTQAGWIIEGLCKSSKSRLWEAALLIKAAFRR